MIFYESWLSWGIQEETLSKSTKNLKKILEKRKNKKVNQEPNFCHHRYTYDILYDPESFRPHLAMRISSSSPLRLRQQSLSRHIWEKLMFNEIIFNQPKTGLFFRLSFFLPRRVHHPLSLLVNLPRLIEPCESLELHDGSADGIGRHEARTPGVTA